MLAPMTPGGTPVKFPPSSGVNVSWKVVVDPGERPGGPGVPPLFLNQIEARGVEKIFFETGHPVILGSG